MFKEDFIALLGKTPVSEEKERVRQKGNLYNKNQNHYLVCGLTGPVWLPRTSPLCMTAVTFSPLLKPENLLVKLLSRGHKVG